MRGKGAAAAEKAAEKSLRKENGKTQEEIAEIFGVCSREQPYQQ